MSDPTLPANLTDVVIAAIVMHQGGAARSTALQIFARKDPALHNLIANPSNVKVEIYEITGVKLIGRHEVTVVTEGVLAK